MSYKNLAQKTANFISEKLSESYERKGKCSLGLSGGKSPVELHKMLAKMLPKEIAANLSIFVVDDRYVPFDSPNSNKTMIETTFIEQLEVSPLNYIYPDTSLPFSECAKDYDQQLHNFVATSKGVDLALIGMGLDGHTSSLFPKFSDSFPCDSNIWSFGAKGPQETPLRISTSFSFLFNVAHLCLYAPGEEKQSLWQRLNKKPYDECIQYPVCRLAKQHKSFSYFFSDLICCR